MTDQPRLDDGASLAATWGVVTRRVGLLVPGIALVVVLAAVATQAAHHLPLLGAPVLAIVVGVLLSRLPRRRTSLRPGLIFGSTRLLQTAVVLLGAQLSLREVAHAGVDSLPVMLGTLVMCLLAAAAAGRALRIEGDLTTLIGVGTAICGASAIAAVSPVLRPRPHAVAYAVSTIFCFNIAAVLVFPPLGHLLGLSQADFGLFAGTAVNDTSSVVAAATTYGPAAADHAVLVKLVRTLMIIPICLCLDGLVRRRSHLAARDAVTTGADGCGAVVSSRARRIPAVPIFLVGFLLAAGLNTAGAIPAESHDLLRRTAEFLTTVALGSIGLSADFQAMRRAGFRPLLLGAILWIVVSTTSLVLQVTA